MPTLAASSLKTKTPENRAIYGVSVGSCRMDTCVLKTSCYTSVPSDVTLTAKSSMICDPVELENYIQRETKTLATASGLACCSRSGWRLPLPVQRVKTASKEHNTSPYQRSRSQSVPKQPYAQK